MLLLAVPLFAACARTEPVSGRPAPWLVIGVDGAERSALERLWERGELPVLHALAERGIFAELATDYGISPVIWTTIATGVPPPRHGITDFVVPTASGDVPVSSAVRRVPALWTMLTRSRRRVAVLGWWATWPAEAVDGLVVTDRVERDVPERIHPPDRAPELREILAGARRGGIEFGGNPASQIQDRVVTEFAARAVREPFDLVLAYFRSVDLASHQSWREFEPEAFDVAAADWRARDPVSTAYRGLDVALGRILAAVPAGTNVLVVSDHGFRALPREQVQLLLDLDSVLAALGLLLRDGPAVDLARSFAFSHDSPDYRSHKLVRFAPPGEEPGEERLERDRRRLARALIEVTFGPHQAAFEVRPPRGPERRRGAHAVVDVHTEAATTDLRVRGRPLPTAVRHLGRITGGHSPRTAGILLAAGPAFRPKPPRGVVSIHDIAPTLLFALGLPVADDFAGAPATALFTDAFVQAHPLRRIASWGVREPGAAPRTADDRKLLEELAGLGYLR